MGANQSSGAGGSSRRKDEAGAEVKTCYYEILGVDGQASEDE